MKTLDSSTLASQSLAQELRACSGIPPSAAFMELVQQESDRALTDYTKWLRDYLQRPHIEHSLRVSASQGKVNMTMNCVRTVAKQFTPLLRRLDEVEALYFAHLCGLFSEEDGLTIKQLGTTVCFSWL